MTGLLVPLLPPSPSFFLPFSFFLSLLEIHVIGRFYFLIYSILWEVTIFGTLEMFTPKGGGGGEQQAKYLEYLILNPHAA